MVRLAAFVAAGWLPPQASGASRLGVVWAADGSFDALYGLATGGEGGHHFCVWLLYTTYLILGVT